MDSDNSKPSVSDASNDFHSRGFPAQGFPSALAEGFAQGARDAVGADLSAPITNRGAEDKPPSFHWFSLTIWRDAPYVTRTMAQWLGFYTDGRMYGDTALVVNPDDWSELPRTAFFGKRYLSSSGVSVLADPFQESPHGKYCSVTISGEVCEHHAIDIPLVVQLMHTLEQDHTHYRFTRVDYAFDYAPFTPFQLLQQYTTGFPVTRFRPKSVKYDYSPTGTTTYIGSRSGERFIRCYDKRGYTRVEIQFNDDRADQVMSALYNGDFYGNWFAGQLRDAIDFPHWQEWKDFFSTPKVGVLVPRPLPHYDRSRQWIRRSVAFTIGALANVSDSEYWDELRQSAVSAFGSASKSQQYRLKQIKASYAF